MEDFQRSEKLKRFGADGVMQNIREFDDFRWSGRFQKLPRSSQVGVIEEGRDGGRVVVAAVRARGLRRPDWLGPGLVVVLRVDRVVQAPEPLLQNLSGTYPADH